MEDREMPRMHKYGESKTMWIMMAIVRHLTAWAGCTKYQANGFFVEQSVPIHQTTWCNIPEECNLNFHHHENIISHTSNNVILSVIYCTNKHCATARCTIKQLNFEVHHPRCVGSITKNFCVLHNTVEHNYISSSSTLGLQLHVSALYVGLFYVK